MSRITCFLALTPSPEIKQILADLINQIRRFPETANVKWIDPQNTHLTLLHFGTIDDERLKTASETLAQICRNTLPFKLNLGNLSYFYKGGDKSESILFVDILDPEKNLNDFFKTLRKTLGEQNFYPPERLSPHITIGHLKQHRYAHEQKRLLEVIVEKQPETSGNWVVERVDLYESLGHRPGGNYHRINNFVIGMQ